MAWQYRAWFALMGILGIALLVMSTSPSRRKLGSKTLTWWALGLFLGSLGALIPVFLVEDNVRDTDLLWTFGGLIFALPASVLTLIGGFPDEHRDDEGKRP